VDELVHHSTPLLGRRAVGEDVYNKVAIRDGLSQNIYPRPTLARTYSFDEDKKSLNRTALEVTRKSERRFVRVWVTVQKKE
jgi:hypothetical protein